MTPLIPLTRDLVLIGGGHSHALVLRMWGMKPLAGVRLTVINPAPTAAYSGMLPGHIAGHYTRDELDIDLVRLCRFAGARLIIGEATAIDRQAKTVTVKGRPPIGYDVASIDIGIHSRMPDLDGFPDHGIPVKPLDQYASRWAAFLEKAAHGEASPDVAVIGAGIGGAELAMAMAHALTAVGVTPRVSLLEAKSTLSGMKPATERKLRRALDQAGITTVFNARVSRVSDRAVILEDGSAVPSSFTCGSAGAKPHDWVGATDLPLQDGFIKVDQTLACVDDPDIFASGDCAHLTHAPRPKAGVYAVRAAPILLHNLRARLTGGQMQSFRPQKTYLKLISLGGKRALAEKAAFTAQGDALWRWKDRIDQKFMDKFRHLPAMQSSPLPERALGVDEVLGDKPLCGGCGAKVGPDTLSCAVNALPAVTRPDVLTDAGDDAAVLDFGTKRQVITVDHLRSFDTDPWRMARIATVHAMGDVWAMGAAPQSVLVSLTLERMGAELRARTLAEIMDGVQSIAGPSGAAIVGGHTSLGAETTIGLTVTGTLEGSQRAITLSGAKPGDALILTRPLGSGTLLAAEMAGLVKGADIVALLTELQRPQDQAARILTDAHAMTDVTGFGLGGHLLAMCKASGIGAELTLSKIPLFSGADALSAAGVRSSIFADNAKAAAAFTGVSGVTGDLLFDPQTSGGLLAAVDKDHAVGLLLKLISAGYHAAIIGQITDQSGVITCQ